MIQFGVFLVGITSSIMFHGLHFLLLCFLGLPTFILGGLQLFHIINDRKGELRMTQGEAVGTARNREYGVHILSKAVSPI